MWLTVNKNSLNIKVDLKKYVCVCVFWVWCLSNLAGFAYLQYNWTYLYSSFVCSYGVA